MDKSVSSFYLELLDHFKELRSYFQDEYNSDLILWNNQDITIEGKSLYWKHWVESGIYFIHDILNEQGKYLTYEEFKCKYKININFIFKKNSTLNTYQLGPMKSIICRDL